MNLLLFAQEYGLNPKKVASTRGGEYASSCPVCGGDDRFRIQPEYKGGRYFCRYSDSCGSFGDAIQFLIDFMGYSFKDAAERVGKTLDDRPTRHRYKLQKETEPTMEAEEKLLPEERWKREAAREVGAAHEVLLADSKRLEWLAGRGLDLEAVKRFKLGWIEKAKFKALKKWGLPIEKNGAGREKKVWLPKGYLIPQYDQAGELTMLQIRMEDLLTGSKMRYYPVKGSTVTPMVIMPEPALTPERTAWAIVESRLDAFLIAHHAGDLVGVMAQGNNSANPTRDAVKMLDVSPCSLNALDYDDAGESSFKKWKKRFKTAKRWPVPKGKDPGDYAKDHGGDIRDWIIAGLPPGLRITRKAKLELQHTPKAEERQKDAPLFVSQKTKCGRTIYITDDWEIRRQLESEEKIIFSHKEVDLAIAFKEDGGDPALLIDFKEIFGGGRINRRIEL
jgi:hypothetical protein